MEIEFIFFHRQLSDLVPAAAGEIGGMVLEEGITGQWP
jgi:hypothetical protein